MTPITFRYATFNAMDAKGCDASGMARRFGAGEMIFVKAHHEDNLRDNVVGDSERPELRTLPTRMVTTCSATLTLSAIE